MKKQVKQRNPVARHLRKFNKAAVHKDRKKESKNGYTKHKKGGESLPFDLLFT